MPLKYILLIKYYLNSIVSNLLFNSLTLLFMEYQCMYYIKHNVENIILSFHWQYIMNEIALNNVRYDSIRYTIVIG